MPYTPSFLVTHNGASLTGITVDAVEISHGRQDIQEQPLPSSMNLRVYSNTGTNLNFKLNDTMEFLLDDTYEFTGFITSVSISMTPGITGQNIAYYDLSCAGPLALLSRTNNGEYTRPQEYENDRIQGLFYRAYSLIWSDLGNAYSTSLRWQDYNQPLPIDWDGFAVAYPFGYGPIITGDPYAELSALPATQTDTLTLAQNVADSSRGVLYDGRDGNVYFNSYLARLTPDFEITMNANMVLTDSINSNLSMGDLVNIADITWTGGVETSSNPVSVDLYGPRVGSKTTNLSTLEAAARMAGDYVSSRSEAKYYVKSFTVPLHIDEIDPSDRFLFQILGLNTIITWPSDLLPEPLLQDNLTCFVEGWTLRASKQGVYLTVYQSPKSFTYGAKLWLEIDNATMWQDYDPAVQWREV